MKKILFNIKSILLITAVIVTATGCKKLLDINEDPNNPGIENATPEVLFPAAVMSTAGSVGGQLAVAGGIWSEYWTQSSNSSQFRDIDAYNLNSTSEVVTDPYEEMYSGALNDYQLIISKAVERQDWRYNLMGTVMKAYTYQVLTDLYDQVPYTEALKGAANLNPKFDDGYSIYVSLIAEIDSALAKDYKSAAFSGAQKSGDFVLSGNLDNWEKFANTLKLKMYLRMVNTKPAESEAGIKALFVAGAPLLDATLGAGIAVFTDVPNKSNPFFEFNIRRLNTTTNIRGSYTFTSWLKANNDPRMFSYFDDSSDTTKVFTAGELAGIHQGDYTATATAQPTYGSAQKAQQRANDPVWLISAPEAAFMRAEALERYFGGVDPVGGLDAKSSYDAAVTKSFSEAGYNSAAGEFLTGIYAYPNGGSFEQKLEAIIVQKWASLPGSHALEAFFEHNRTGYPVQSPVYSQSDAYIPGQWVVSKNSFIGNAYPKRFVFPEYERTRNSNTPPEVSISTKVWWSK